MEIIHGFEDFGVCQTMPQGLKSVILRLVDKKVITKDGAYALLGELGYGF